MSRTPQEHYDAADKLLAEVAEVRPWDTAQPLAQVKLARAVVHAILAHGPLLERAPAFSPVQIALCPQCLYTHDQIPSTGKEMQHDGTDH
jgi:hypothetical protein